MKKYIQVPLVYKLLDIIGGTVVANTAQAKKRALQASNRHRHNASLRSQLRTAIKKVIAAIGTSDHAQATQMFKCAQPIIDKMASKGIIHKNKAARHKSRLNAKIKAIVATV